MNIIQVGIMILQGMASALFDPFFLMGVMIVWLLRKRIATYADLIKGRIEKPIEETTELLFWSIVIGFVLSMIVTMLGFPVKYTQYLYYLMPMSFIIGLMHPRFLDVVYSGGILSLIAAFLNGQEMFGRTMPNVEVDGFGLLLIIGWIKCMEGIIFLIRKRQQMVPILIKKDQRQILGFFQFWLWPIPFSLLVFTSTVMAGETVPMPTWWPLFNPGENMMLFLLPLIWIAGDGNLIIDRKPITYMRQEGIKKMVLGVCLIAVGAWGQIAGAGPWISVVVLLLALAYRFYDQVLAAEDGQELDVSRDGLYVTYVKAGGIMHGIGVEQGDRIVGINGKKLLDYESFYLNLGAGMGDVTYEKTDGRQIEKTFPKPVEAKDGLGIVLLGPKAEKIYEYEDVKKLGLLAMNRFIRSIKE